MYSGRPRMALTSASYCVVTEVRVAPKPRARQASKDILHGRIDAAAHDAQEVCRITPAPLVDFRNLVFEPWGGDFHKPPGRAPAAAGRAYAALPHARNQRR